MTDRSVYIDRGSSTSTGLLDRAMLHQADAWGKLVKLYGPLVYRWCRHWGLQPKDAENVGQEVFLRVLQGLPAFRGDSAKTSFRAWLFRIARNCFLDYIRQAQTIALGEGGSQALQRLERVPAKSEVYDDSEESKRDDDALVFHQAVALIRSEFSPRDWTAFQQLVMGDRSAAEVAHDLQVSVNVVYLAKSRVLRRLREEFEELIDF